MIRGVLAAVALCLATAGLAAAAVEVNTADQSQLETIKGIGPSMSSRILAERRKGEFRDWADLAARVPGIGERNSAAFSAAGLTVAGKPKRPAAAARQVDRP